MTTMTAAQRREEAKAGFGAYMDACPTHDLVGVIGNEWTSVVLFQLTRGPRRYAELARALPGVSAKMLTRTLRSMERDGFVARSVTPSVPVQVEYTLTLLGERLVPLFESVRHFAEHNIAEIRESRERYDASADRAGSARGAGADR